MSSNRTDRILQALIGVLLCAFVYVLFTSLHERVVGVGDTAPDFSIQTDAGRTISTSNFGGRILVLNFWATWCAPCIQELPSLNQFQKRFQQSGLVVLGISVDKDEKVYRDFLRKVNVSFLTARDPQNKINTDYGTFKFPETYFIDTNGKVIQKIVGPADWNDEKMVGYVQSLL